MGANDLCPGDWWIWTGNFTSLIWVTCTAMIYGVGFVPLRWYWQVFFTPYLALPILSYIMWLRLFSS